MNTTYIKRLILYVAIATLLSNCASKPYYKSHTGTSVTKDRGCKTCK